MRKVVAGKGHLSFMQPREDVQESLHHNNLGEVGAIIDMARSLGS